MEVEPPAATLPDRAAAVEDAVEPAAVEAEEEAEPPQAVRAAAAAAAPQTVRNERRVIFFIIFVLQTSGLSVPGSCFRVFLGYGTIVSQSENRFDHKREKSR